MQDLESLRPWQMMERWGLRVVGGSLKDPTKVSTGGSVGADDELAMVCYVEQTIGFEQAKSVLLHVFAYGQTTVSYKYQTPQPRVVVLAYHRIAKVPTKTVVKTLKESRGMAAIRHGQLEFWKECNRLGFVATDAQLADRCLFDFLVRFNERCKREPFRVPDSRHDDDPEGDSRRIARESTEQADRKHPQRFTSSRDTDRKPLDLRDTGYETRNMRRMRRKNA